MLRDAIRLRSSPRTNYMRIWLRLRGVEPIQHRRVCPLTCFAPPMHLPPSPPPSTHPSSLHTHPSAPFTPNAPPHSSHPHTLPRSLHTQHYLTLTSPPHLSRPPFWPAPRGSGRALFYMPSIPATSAMFAIPETPAIVATQPVWVEHEGRHVGSCLVPARLYETLRSPPLLLMLEASRLGLN